ncbi:Nucleolar protein 58 [Conglomerata obtusa]
MLTLLESCAGYTLLTPTFTALSSYEFIDTSEALLSISALQNSTIPETLLTFLTPHISLQIVVGDTILCRALVKAGFNAIYDLPAYRSARLHVTDDTIMNIFYNDKSCKDNSFKDNSGKNNTDTKSEVILKGSKHTYRDGLLYCAHRVAENRMRGGDVLDVMVIQAIRMLDDMDRDVNGAVMRVKEWYGCFFPELAEVVPDASEYLRCVRVIESREVMDAKRLISVFEDEDPNKNVDTNKDNNIDTNDNNNDNNNNVYDSNNNINDNCNNITNDINEDNNDIFDKVSERTKVMVQKILKIAETSVGTELNKNDMLQIQKNCETVLKTIKYKKDLSKYLENKMKSIAPNLTALVGDIIGARLISKAGGLSGLSKMAASTVQILGAEKAFFTAIKGKSNTPKYGIIYNSSLIGKAEEKGKVARMLGCKIGLCCRVDYYGTKSRGEYGIKIKEELENKMNNRKKKENKKRNFDASRNQQRKKFKSN